MQLKFLDPEVAMKLLEGHEDIITKAAEQREKFYAAQSCPRCGGSCVKHGDFRTMFTGDEPLPKFMLKCLACGEIFDPHTGLIVKTGNIAQALVPAVPILKTED
jgi:hypothetical protein